MSDRTTVKFEAPGPGPWEIDATHFPRPASRFGHDAVEAGFAKGFAYSCARYGLLLDRLQPGVVNGFLYNQPVPFGAPPGATKPPPKLVLQLLTRLVPKMRRRIADSHAAITQKRWREDLKRWDDEVKPRSIREHLALQNVDPRSLDDAALADHLRACSARMAKMVEQHHVFTITCSLPVGDFLVHASAWTGKTPGEVLQALRGSSPISNGVAVDELDALAKALRADEGARALLDGADPRATLDALVTAPGEVGAAARAYVAMVGHRCLGYDVSSRYALEMPEVLVRAIRAAMAGATGDEKAATKRRIAALREAVPEAHRAEFDELLEEARLVNRLRDERGHYSDGWSTGLARRALLEIGRRLVERGRIDDAELAVDASADEILALLAGQPGPTRDELAERARWRKTKTASDPDVPKWLNAPPPPPPPVEWLPEPARRSQRAVDAFLACLFGEAETAKHDERTVRGLPVSPGVYEGTARLVRDEADFAKIEQGDVLVARATSPYFNVVLPLLGAIVTDRGGQLSHAAIVSREYGVPGVVGTREATARIPDGARVRVDGDRGEVQVIG